MTGQFPVSLLDGELADRLEAICAAQQIPLTMTSCGAGSSGFAFTTAEDRRRAIALLRATLSKELDNCEIDGALTG